MSSDIHGVPFNDCAILFNNYLTTCFKYCWKKLILLSEVTKHFRQNLIHNCRKIQSQFKQQIISRTTGVKLYEHKIQIIAKLVLSVLTKENCIKHNQSGNNTNNRMTIIDINFVHIREEYPSIDAEVRGILLSRAQYGSTINDIQSDYHKLTGQSFPVKENITEFLLSVPHVMVYTDENGTRIFNIMPEEKTKHLLELVLHQNPKKSQQRTHRDAIYHKICNTNNNNHHSNAHCYNNDNHENCHLSCTSNIYPKNIIEISQQRQGQGQRQHSNVVPPNWNFLQRHNNRNENNCFYQDNCSYFYNRLYNKQKTLQQITTQINPSYLNNKRNSSYITPCHNGCPNYDFNMKVNHHLCHSDCNEQIINRPEENSTTTESMQNLIDPLNHCCNMRRPSSPTRSYYEVESLSTESDYEAHLFDFLLLGDDFLLYLARMELGCKFKRNERILQSGLCVSGQSISDATRRLNEFNICGRSIIINIGSVDIMRGHQLIKIEHDFRELITTILRMNATPILTTLAPLANHVYDQDIKTMVLRFNDYIRREANSHQFLLIDIYTCMVNTKGRTLFGCYQKAPRLVSGTTESHVFWNKIGRQRILRLIESHLEY